MAPDFMRLQLTSPDFGPEERLADAFTQSGENRTPRLEVTGIPQGTAELAIIVHDPDAPRPHGFTHWTLYGLPAQDGPIVPDEGRPGPNDAGGIGYTGPKPPSGHGVHHYFFFVYALSRPVAGAPSRLDFLDGYADAVLAVSRLVGTYSN
ncbi:YbhB/YbcL family Raf kinase inhibitor-like protein [Brooklawnia cerclae]|uniref:YbhB/YbcL family Raf kinase inhibitor-like protein n=1 Tax=Brooklawnia cerclae TaxID=349934 RepID=A0ABX0SJQ2_9ACTN|nr:YbhB/YbcL family Raf kinase inhibitor-like protein [Brooklawnia cerclae]NIH58652.1 hypothetical protein [Brooklawnia cerclae]